MWPSRASLLCAVLIRVLCVHGQEEGPPRFSFLDELERPVSLSKGRWVRIHLRDSTHHWPPMEQSHLIEGRLVSHADGVLTVQPLVERTWRRTNAAETNTHTSYGPLAEALRIPAHDIASLHYLPRARSWGRKSVELSLFTLLVMGPVMAGTWTPQSRFDGDVYRMIALPSLALLGTGLTLWIASPPGRISIP